MKVMISLIATYVTAFIVTYGHAYQHVGSVYVGENAIGAFISSLFWPLYWSIQAWK
jgi:hypothetical protein